MWGSGAFGRPKLYEPCVKFYKEKTMDRLDKFLSDRDKSYLDSHIVNGRSVGKIKNMLEDFKWDKLFDGISTEFFHGDLQFDNVIYGDDRNFYLLDWRQDFAGDIVGDVYYDLAKMYGGVLMSYK